MKIAFTGNVDMLTSKLKIYDSKLVKKGISKTMPIFLNP